MSANKGSSGPQNPTSLSLLEQAVRSPNGVAWSRFVDIYGALIQKWLLSLGLPFQEVDDLRQDVMAIVVRELPKFQHNGNTGAFRNWMRTITANRLRQFRRKAGRERQMPGADVSELADQLGDSSSALSGLWNREHDDFVLQRLLEIVAGRVQKKTLEAFRRVVLQQEKTEDVARDLGMKPGAVRVAQSRVLRALREEGRGMID